MKHGVITRLPRVLLAVCLLLQTMVARVAMAQADGNDGADSPTYRLRVAVNEVILTFHAEDTAGLPANDLKAGDVSLLDNGKAPRRVLTFQLMKDFPIRAGILVDSSTSMRASAPADRAIAGEYVQKLLRQQTDKAFVMEFGRIAKILQPWSNDPALLTKGIHEVTAGGPANVSGTAIFDTLLGACLYQFGKLDNAASGNVVMIFTDGEDNASTVYLKDAVDMCQRSNTAIYAFRPGLKPGAHSSGLETLNELASETGGRVFAADGTAQDISQDLRIIEADLRNQYRVVYNPAELKHDGSFHTVKLTTPQRFVSVTVRAGYYAPAR